MDPDYVAPPLRMDMELPNTADGSLLKDMSPGQAEELITQFYKVDFRDFKSLVYLLSDPFAISLSHAYAVYNCVICIHQISIGLAPRTNHNLLPVKATQRAGPMWSASSGAD